MISFFLQSAWFVHIHEYRVHKYILRLDLGPRTILQHSEHQEFDDDLRNPEVRPMNAFLLLAHARLTAHEFCCGTPETRTRGLTLARCIHSRQ